MCTVLLTFFATSCKKDVVNGELNNSVVGKTSNGQVSSRSDSDDALYNQKLLELNTSKEFKQIVLGDEIQNPYTLENMTQAYLNVYGHNPTKPLPITHKYVKLVPKFKVTEEAIVSDDAIHAQTYPISRKVVEPGQYYIPPGKTAEDIREFYASVPANYVVPKNVVMELITNMFIPAIAAELENEAFLLTDNLPDDHDYVLNRDERIREVRENPCRDFPSEIRNGDYEPCEGPPSSKCTGKHRLRVENMGVATIGAANLAPVIFMNVKVHNTWKSETTQTNHLGNFVLSNTYNVGARVDVIFRGNRLVITRRDNLVTALNNDPIEKEFGHYKKSSFCDGLDLIIPSPTPTKLGTYACLYYASALVNNGVYHVARYAIDSLAMASIPILKIVMTDRKGPHHAATLMLSDLLINQSANNVMISAAGFYLQVPISLVATPNIKTWAYDLIFGYGDDGDKSGVNPNVQPAYYFNFFNTDRYDEMVFHELSHMLHYTKVTPTIWKDFGLAEYKNPDNGPGTYGPCCTKYSPIIAVGETWAYHMGHVLADKKWNGLSTFFPEQGDIDQ